MNELAMAYSRGAKGPIQVKQENEMLHLRKRVKELEAERTSFVKRMEEMEALVDELQDAAPESKIQIDWDGLGQFGHPLSVDLKVLEEPIPARIKKETITQAVIGHFGISYMEIMGHQKSARVALPRQIAMYLCGKHTTWSLVAIGKFFGGKDHTTVIHARKRIQRMVESDSGIAIDVKQIEKDLGIGT